MTASKQHVVIIGGGVGGLMSALALAPIVLSITIIEKDPAPPEGGVEAAFQSWDRRGVGQFRHSHAFLARLLNILREHHPELLDQLMAAGAKESTFAEFLPAALADDYVPKPGDERMNILVSRRSTLELILRQYVERLSGVVVWSSQTVAGLTFGPPTDGMLKVTGVKLQTGAVCGADLVIDASGRLSRTPEWLASAGAGVTETEQDAGIVYFTRHYRLRPHKSEPAAAGSGTGDLSYLKYGVFNADNGWFSVTLAVPEVEERLRSVIMQSSVFDAICDQLPGVRRWTDPERSEPMTKVLGMGDLKSRWRSLVDGEGRPAALDLFMVGDGLVRSNPLYGRGCTFAAIQAFALAEVLSSQSDPVLRARAYQQRLDEDLGFFYQNMLTQDTSAIRRARRAIHPQARRSIRSRVLKSLVEDAVTPALRSNIAPLRAALASFHMLAPPNAWLRKPGHLLKVLTTWAIPRSFKRTLYSRSSGPSRLTLFAALGLRADPDGRPL